MPKKRNLATLIGLGVLYFLVFWFGSLLLVGFVAGALNPTNGAAAGEAAGRVASPLALLISLIVAPFLTVLGVLPGTRKHRPGKDAAPDAPQAAPDLAALEKLSELHKAGVLNDEEFAGQKRRILGSS